MAIVFVPPVLTALGPAAKWDFESQEFKNEYRSIGVFPIDGIVRFGSHDDFNITKEIVDFGWGN